MRTAETKIFDFDPPEIEYIDGVGYPKMSPKRAHSRVQGALMRIVERCCSGRGEADPELRIRLGAGNELVPDLAYYSFDRLRALPESDREEPPIAPEIAIEVRSKSERRGLLEKKVAKYLAAGTALVVVADPYRGKIEAIAAKGRRAFVAGERFETDAVAWLTFDVDEVFASLEIPEK